MVDTKSVLNDEFVLVGYEASDREDVLRALVALLARRGAVKDSYLEAVIAREREFPTGLPTEDVRVALPHAGAEHVNYSALAVAVLARPVTFCQMGDPDCHLDVEIVLMLANADPKEQVNTLRRLVEMFGEPGALQALKAAKSRSEVVRIIVEGLHRDKQEPTSVRG